MDRIILSRGFKPRPTNYFSQKPVIINVNQKITPLTTVVDTLIPLKIVSKIITILFGVNIKLRKVKVSH